LVVKMFLPVYVTFKVFTTVKMSIVVLRVTRPCSLVDGAIVEEKHTTSVFIVEMRAMCSSVTLVTIYMETWYHNPELHDPFKTLLH
jgi:hypothetical protein